MRVDQVIATLAAKQDALRYLRAASARLKDGGEHVYAMGVEAIILNLDDKIEEFIRSEYPIIERKRR